MSSPEVAREQAYVDLLYARLDALRAETAAELARTRRAGPTGSPQNRSERDAFAAFHEDRLGQLNGVEDRLCFGRLDLRDGERRYVGRIGLADAEQHRLLVDWRAPAAQDFYRATAAQPGEAVRRRHLTTRGRTVTSVEDEVFDLDAFPGEAAGTLSGEGVLLAALNAHRTGRMGDIVATIQAEQDEVIRADLRGVLVVQGGPGTGKTAVALHRAAFLLYTHRDRLARSGVLLVGPGPVFLRYIERVLPSLGETGVVMSTPAELFPGVVGEAPERPEVAALKGDLRMAAVVARAVANLQRVPAQPVSLVVEGTPVVLRPGRVAAARDRARRTGRPHNAARVGVVTELLNHLCDEVGRALRVQLNAEDRREVIADLRASVEVRRALNRAWPLLAPTAVVADLWANPRRLAAAAPWLDQAGRDLLARPRDAAWTAADVPLLDEAAELLGEDEDALARSARRAARAEGEERRYAQEVLSSSGAGGGMVTAAALAERFAERGPSLSVADRAAHDRTWAYGHIVVDEAQELSPMLWRLLMRRCPTRSMTVVGDVAQTGSAAGASSWAAVLDPYVAGRWRLAELSVNYRTPREVMDAAAAMLAAAGVSAPTPRSARDGEWPPTAGRVPADELAGPGCAALVTAVRAELDVLGEGRLAVIGPRSGHETRVAALQAALPAGTARGGSGALDAPVAVLTVDDAKGLEFDTVVLVEPAAVLAESPRGANDLYVAMTRSTQRLRVLHSLDLPAGLESLRPA